MAEEKKKIEQCNGFCKKTQYGSKSAADADIKRIAKKSSRSIIPIRSYRCRFGFWHLTSKEDMFKTPIGKD